MASTTAPDCRVASARAVGLGTYPSSRPARSTASLVARLACPDRLMARDAAERDTPASRATSSSVGRRLGGVVIGPWLRVRWCLAHRTDRCQLLEALPLSVEIKPTLIDRQCSKKQYLAH